MPISAFISYSHADDAALNRLHKHLAMLRRDEVLNAWTDHAILAGDRLDETITKALKASRVFLALVSADYLASNYCYEKEFRFALELAESGTLRIVPVILQPCEWTKSPLSHFMALPKDGKPVSEWTNENNAFLDVVTNLRRMLDSMSAPPPSNRSPGRPASPERRIRLKQDFDAIQKAEFIDNAFEAMAQYFADSCQELNTIDGANVKAKFERMDSNAFTCTIVNRTRLRGGEAHITVRNGKGQRHFGGGISYVYERYAEPGTSNGFVQVEADDYSLYLSMDRFSQGDGEQRYQGKEAAEALWLDMARKAGVEYE